MKEVKWFGVKVTFSFNDRKDEIQHGWLTYNPDWDDNDSIVSYCTTPDKEIEIFLDYETAARAYRNRKPSKNITCHGFEFVEIEQKYELVERCIGWGEVSNDSITIDSEA